MATIASGHVDVWAVTLDSPGMATIDLAIDGHLKVLAVDEVERANRFHFVRDTRRFVVTRSTLRSLLGLYLNQDAAAIQFTYGPYGKPDLAAAMAATPLYFNVSHSEDVALIAVSRSYPLGVDVEAIQDGFPIDEVAPMFFCPQELQILNNLPPALRRLRFYSYWTRKEAYVKARGWGLSCDPARIDVSGADESMGQNAERAVIQVRVDGAADPSGLVVDLAGPAGFAASLATIGGPAQINLRPALESRMQA